MSYQRVAMVVAAQDQGLAQQIAVTLVAAAGNAHSADVMWTTPCSPTGTAPASHYITEGPIQPQFAALLGDAPNTYTACQQAGMTVTQQQIADMYSRATFSAGADPLALLATLGLQLIASPA